MKKTWIIIICVIVIGIGAMGTEREKKTTSNEETQSVETNKPKVTTTLEEMMTSEVTTTREETTIPEETTAPKEAIIAEETIVPEETAEPKVIQKTTEKAVADPTATPVPKKTVIDPTPAPVKEADEQEYHWVLNTNTKKVHYPNCKSVGLMKEHNRAESTLSPEELKKKGYSPCGNCKPFPK